MQILTVDKVYKKIQSLNANFGNVKRQFTCASIDHNDEYVYCGTKLRETFSKLISRRPFIKESGLLKNCSALEHYCG